MSRNRELSQFPEFLTVNDTYGSVGIGTSLTVSGIGTFENDLYVAGTLYASSLNITGGATLGDDLTTRNISASGIVTVTGNTDLNGDLDVDGHTELDNVRISGFLTATSAEFSGNVTIGGTLIYEDVTNVDSIGIATARSGLRITGGGLDVVGVATFNDGIDTLDVIGHAEVDQLRVSGVSTFQGNVNLGDNIEIRLGDATNGDLALYHDGSDSYIVDRGTGSLNLRGTNLALQAANGENYINCTENAAVVIRYNNLAKIETTTSGVSVTGTTDTDQLNVSGVSTFVGITTTQDNVFVGNDLSVAGDARIVGVLTVGSSSITLDGSTNTINVGSGVTVHTTTVAVNQLEVAGLSTFVGVGTFQSDLFVGSTLYTPALVVNGSSVGDDITTRNISASGIVTVTGNTDLNGDLDVDGHTELDNLNVSGVSTFASAVDINADLDVDGRAELDTANISETLNVVGVSTFGSDVDINANVDISGNIDVDGHTELDNLNVSGVATFAQNVEITGSLTVNGNQTILNTTILEVEDINIGIASADPKLSNAQLDGAGITIHGAAGDKTLTWNNANSRMEFNTDLSATNISSTDLTLTGDLDVDGHTELDNLNVSGVSTFAGAADFNGDVDIDGRTELDITNISETLNVVGISTFESDVDINASIDVDGHTELDDLNVSGVSTFASAVDINSNLDVDGRTELDITNISETLNVVGVSTFGSDVDINASVDIDGHTELDNVNISGVLTATSAEFSGNVTVLGDLTYENVVNVDAIGIATARSGLRVTGGGLDVVGVATFNNGVDTLDVIGHAEVDQLRVSGVSTLTGDTFVGSAITFYSSTGIVSATSFYGDASNLTGIPAGLGTALSQTQTSPLNKLYYTDTILGIANTITVNPPDSSNIAYTQYAEIVVDQDADLIVEDGDDLIADVFSLSTGTAAPLSGAGGRIRADNFTSKSGTGAPAFPYGVVVTGVVTATSFVGDGSALTGVDSTSIKDPGGNVKVQAQASGIVVTGISTFSGNIDANGDLDVDGHTELDNVNVSGVSTFAGNVSIGSSILLGDNNKVLLGTGNDFEIYYDGGIAHIDSNAGQIRMRSNSSMLFYNEGPGGNEDYAKFLHNGAVELYYDGSKKFETTGYGATVFGGLNVSGNVVVTGDVISLSDQRSKENIRPLNNALNIISNIDGVYYNLKTSPERNHVGVIAQNIEKVLPEVVYESNGSKSVAYGNITAVLIEAVKELKQEIEELKFEIKELKK